MSTDIRPATTELSELLVRFGFSDVKAELWSRYVGEVVAILQAAADELQTASAWAAFSSKRGALGRPKIRKKAGVIERRPIEDAITAELGHIARRLRAAVPTGHFLRLHEVVFATEHLVESVTRTGRHSRKVDFFIYAQAGDAPPELAIEAKPLHAKADIVGRYLAEEGMGCFFAADTPYTNRPLAGMLAYTMHPGGGSQGPDIRAALRALTPAPLSVDDIGLWPLSKVLLCSRHERPAVSPEPVAIVHLEMLFAPETAPIA